MNSFLTVFQDEALLSVVQRYVVMDCASTYKKAAKSLFGSSSLQFCSHFSSVIPTLIQLGDLNHEQWVNRHTILPIYKAFTPANRYLDAYNHLINGRSEEVFKSLSFMANRQNVFGEMKYCPQCAKEDLDAVGLAYWRVMHNLPGVYVCYKHFIRLHSKTVTRKRFDNWPSSETHIPVKASQNEMGLVRFAKYFQYHSDESTQKHSLSDIYRTRLDERGFITQCGHVRLKKLRHEIIKFHASLLRYDEVKFIFNSERYPLFPDGLLHNKSGIIAPLKHLLLMTFLFRSVRDFLNCDVMLKKKLFSVETVKVNKNDDKDIITSLLNRGDSLRHVAEQTHHSVTYVKKVAKVCSLKIESRAQKLFATERRQIAIKLMAGSSTDKIAEVFDCSQGAVEQILSQHLDIVQLRKLKRYREKCLAMRQSLLATIDSIQNPRRQAIKTDNSKAYLWLFKHDKNWLYDNLPKEIPRNQRHSR
jgi:hypothetical protein